MIFATEPSPLADALRERIETAGGIVTLVVPGSRYQRLAGGSVRLDPTDRAQFDRLFEETACKLAGIVNLWPIAPGEAIREAITKAAG